MSITLSQLRPPATAKAKAPHILHLISVMRDITYRAMRFVCTLIVNLASTHPSVAVHTHADVALTNFFLFMYTSMKGICLTIVLFISPLCIAFLRLLCIPSCYSIWLHDAAGISDDVIRIWNVCCREIIGQMYGICDSHAKRFIRGGVPGNKFISQNAY